MTLFYPSVPLGRAMRNLAARWRRGLLLLLLLGAGNAWSQATPPSEPRDADRVLTLDEALRIFRTRGFDLLIADTAVESAQGDVIIAGARANPQISLSRGMSANYDPRLCAGCSNVSVSVSLSDPTTISDLFSGKRRLRLDVARAALSSLRFSRADVERMLEVQVKQQLLQAQLAKASLSFARRAEASAAQTLDLIEKRYRAGAVSEADVARAEIQKLEAEQAVATSQQALDTSKAALAFLLGERSGQSGVEVGDDLVRSRMPAKLADLSREALLRDALENRPDLRAIRAQVERARSALDLARRLRVPDVSPSLQFSEEGSGQNAIQPPTVTLGVSMALPVLYRYRGEIAKAEADLRSQTLQQRKIEAQVASDVSAAFAAYQGSRERVGRMEGRLLDRAQR
ncbi:MAG TPA: TolC family protein, partial [Thermoanaerobaculia bacterium]|nr:TolC family protein [Thermoanaerobaculia bacterium]